MKAALDVLDRESQMLCRQRCELSASCRSNEKASVAERVKAIDLKIAQIELAAVVLREALR